MDGCRARSCAPRTRCAATRAPPGEGGPAHRARLPRRCCPSASRRSRATTRSSWAACASPATTARRSCSSPGTTCGTAIRLYADTASGMLIKAVTVDPAGEPVEQFSFTQLRRRGDARHGEAAPRLGQMAHRGREAAPAPRPPRLGLSAPSRAPEGERAAAAARRVAPASSCIPTASPRYRYSSSRSRGAATRCARGLQAWGPSISIPARSPTIW